MESIKYKKQLYLPTMDELYKIQEMHGNVYKYLMVKAIESIICSGINYPNEGMLIGTTSHFKNGEIARAICTLYPEEMKYAISMIDDYELCDRLISHTSESRFCGLDYLKNFSQDILNNELFKKIIFLLEKELRENPKYRFEYEQDNPLNEYKLSSIIDSIFKRKIQAADMITMKLEEQVELTKLLVAIEPTYALSLPDYCFEYNLLTAREEILRNGINYYANRYGLSMNVGAEYTGKDILTNPNQDVKRLMRCINSRKKKTQIL